MRLRQQAFNRLAVVVFVPWALLWAFMNTGSTSRVAVWAGAVALYWISYAALSWIVRGFR